jgi:hypothetical protein
MTGSAPRSMYVSRRREQVEAARGRAVVVVVGAKGAFVGVCLCLATAPSKLAGVEEEQANRANSQTNVAPWR